VFFLSVEYIAAIAFPVSVDSTGFVVAIVALALLYRSHANRRSIATAY
jgi:hypothetical protein